MTAPSATTEPAAPRGFWRATGALLGALAIGVLGAGIGGGGFAVSFDTLTDIAKPVLPGDIPGTVIPWAAVFPATLDGAIVFISALRVILAMRGKRMTIAELIELSLIAATVVLNATAGETTRSVIIHALLPSLYVVAVWLGTQVILGKFEAIREKTRGDRLTIGRWLLAPVDTFSLWRNMKIAGTGSFRVAIRLERHKIQRYQTWRSDRGILWWLPVRTKAVSRADRKALRLELAEIAIDASRPAAGIPARPETATVPHLAVPAPRPTDIPQASRPVPAGHPADVPAVPATASRPVPAAPSRDVPADPEALVPGETTRIGDLGFTTLYTPEQHKQVLKAAVRDFLDPGTVSPYASQAELARALNSTTSTVSRMAQQIKTERVNGSAAAHG